MQSSSLARALNPHRHLVLYQAETDFGRVDIYRGLARALGLEPSYRRAQLWRDIKLRVHELVDAKQVTPLWIIDEAQNLPAEFFRDFPALLNFAFDSHALITVWLVGHPLLAQMLEQAPYTALHSRLQARVQLKARGGARTLCRADRARPQKRRLPTHAGLHRGHGNPAPGLQGLAPTGRTHPV